MADKNSRLARELWIKQFHWYSISEIMAPSSLKLTIVGVIGPKEYFKLINKFWNASKKSATSALADLQLKLPSVYG